jgi:AraC-like DNA-binding protein
MIYQKFCPSPHLRPFIECYFVWEKHGLLAEPLRIESPPTGFASMVFTYGDAYQVRTEKGVTTAPKAFLTGQATRQYELALSGQIGMVGIVFRPSGISTLFGLPMYEFADERVALADVLGPSLTDLHEAICEHPTTTGRIALLEQFINRQLLRRGDRSDRTDYAANLIVDKFGVLTVIEILDDLYVCRRQFERQFLQKVGVSPKYYARIRRVGHLCAQLATQRWQVSDWQDFVFRAGYYDQSHFIREFKQVTGKRPTLYLKDNTELSQYL